MGFGTMDFCKEIRFLWVLRHTTHFVRFIDNISHNRVSQSHHTCSLQNIDQG
jgi:hypothetical protein